MPKFTHFPLHTLRKQGITQQNGQCSHATVARINRLPEQAKYLIYAQLIPPSIFPKFQIDPESFCNAAGEPVLHCMCASRISSVRIELRHQPQAQDPIFLLEMQDTPFGDIEIVFLNMNDPFAERFNIDQDAAGNTTAFATISRNIQEEIRAMQAGLAPGQIRRGLRLFRSFLVQARLFGKRFDVKQVKVEPLAYHNAIMHEFYGFRYMSGRDTMERINREFAPGGLLFKRLDASTPFRHPSFAQSIRGRSWAIHDGILEEPWQCPRMYYAVDAPKNHPCAPITFRMSQ